MASQYRVEVHPQYKYKRIQPTPTDEEIERYYQEEFYSTEYKKFNDPELEVQLADREFFESNWQSIIGNLEHLTGASAAGKKILDIGCGWGLALQYYAGLGLEVFGLDPSPEAVAYAAKNGISVKQSGIKSFNLFEDETFDFVTLMNVLEHIAAPEEYLQMINSEVMSDHTDFDIDVPNEFNRFQVCGQQANVLDQWWGAPPQHRIISTSSRCHVSRRPPVWKWSMPNRPSTNGLGHGDTMSPTPNWGQPATRNVVPSKPTCGNSGTEKN